MSESRNARAVRQFEEYLANNDIEKITQELPKLLKLVLKLDTRMDRILKQSDNQQIEMLKLKENIEEKNNRISTLLDNAGQGFLYFDENLIIGSEYSKEAKRIFAQEIAGLDISTLLYDDASDGEFFKFTLQGILQSDEFQQEVLISLLKNEFIINDAYIEVEYKVLNEHSFMLILTDVTAKKKLAQQIKDEQQVLKMVVETVTTLEQFVSVKADYEAFVSKLDGYKSLDRLSSLRKEIHTYKGLFAQKEMLNIVKRLHDFESIIDTSLKNNQIDEQILNTTSQDMLNWLQEDIDVLVKILGEEFFEKSDNLSIPKQKIQKLYEKIELYLKTRELEHLVQLGKEIKKLQYTNIKLFFKPYIKLVEQLSKRLHKDIKPLQLDCDDIYIPDDYKPFLNSLVHIFRNSVDHGIEIADVRLEHNKDYEGTIKCSVKHIDNNIVISISDDGAGIDTAKIKALAVKKGIYTQEEVDKLSEDEALRILFQDAFSTSDTVTDISGRGVGLASVLTELEKLNGNLQINNNLGNGVEFVFTVPYKD
jgi:two-component system chemotaxis sensor kinase CheA